MPAIDYRLLLGRCEEALAELPDESVGAVAADPPYELGIAGHAWDKTGVAFSVAMWREVYRTMKPGGLLLSFGGARTYHRMACAVEDAGFTIRDSIPWLYSQGMPKTHTISAAYRKAGEDALAERWEGYETGLKPAHEQIVLAQKPFKGTIAANVARHGVGVLNIDACRIAAPGAVNPQTKGRWPANVVLDEDAARRLDEQSGVLKSGYSAGFVGERSTSVAMSGAYLSQIKPESIYADSGGASRFFYCAKASPKERGEGNDHPSVKPLRLMEWLVRLVAPPGCVVLDPFVGSGTTGVACVNVGRDFIGIDMDQHYLDIARRRIEEAMAACGVAG